MSAPGLRPAPFTLDALRGHRLWLTGARGFIGRALAAAATAQGAEVIAFPGDVRDEDAVISSILTVRPRFLVHLAALVDVRRDPALLPAMDAVIVGGAKSVREGLRRLHPLDPEALLVQVGTCEEYGTIPAPFAESDRPSAPVSPYAAAKLRATEQALADAAIGLPLVVARPFLTYGPGQTGPQLVPTAIRAALTGARFPMTEGSQTRELNFIDDTVQGLLLCAVTPAVRGQIINVGGGEERRVVDLVRAIYAAVDAPESLIEPGALPTRPGEVPRFCCDATRCRTLLGHRHQVSLSEGLARTIAALRLELP